MVAKIKIEIEDATGPALDGIKKKAVDVSKAAEDAARAQTESFQRLAMEAARADGNLRSLHTTEKTLTESGRELQQVLDSREAAAYQREHNAELQRLADLLDGTTKKATTLAQAGTQAGARGDHGGGFSEIIEQLNTTNLTGGHETQLRTFGKLLDGLSPQMLNSAGVIRGVTAAVNGAVTAVDYLDSHGSVAAAQIKASFAETGKELEKFGKTVDEAIGARAARAFDSAVRTAQYLLYTPNSVEAFENKKFEDSRKNALGVMRETKRQKHVEFNRDRAEALGASGRMLESNTEGRDRRRLLANVGQDFSRPDVPRPRGFRDLINSDRTKADEALEMLSGSGLSPTEQAAREGAGREARAQDAAKRQAEADRIAALKERQREQDRTIRGASAQLDRLSKGDVKLTDAEHKTFFNRQTNIAAEATARKAELEREVSKILEEQAHRLEYINALEDKAEADERARIARRKEARERQQDLDRVQIKFTESEREKANAADIANIVSTANRKAGYARADADREREYMRGLVDASRATLDEQQTSKAKVAKLENDAKKIEQERFETQSNALKAQQEKQKLDLDATRALQSQKALDVEAAKNDNARAAAAKELNKARERENELLAKIHDTASRINDLERDRKHEIQLRTEIEARRDEEDRHHAEEMERDRRQKIQDGAASHVMQAVGSQLHEFAGGIDPRQAAMSDARRITLRDAAKAGNALGKFTDDQIDDMIQDTNWGANDKKIQQTIKRNVARVARDVDDPARAIKREAQAMQRTEQERIKSIQDPRERQRERDALRAKTRSGGFIQDARVLTAARSEGARARTAAAAARDVQKNPAATDAEKKAAKEEEDKQLALAKAADATAPALQRTTNTINRYQRNLPRGPRPAKRSRKLQPAGARAGDPDADPDAAPAGGGNPAFFNVTDDAPGRKVRRAGAAGLEAKPESDTRPAADARDLVGKIGGGSDGISRPGGGMSMFPKLAKSQQDTDQAIVNAMQQMVQMNQQVLQTVTQLAQQLQAQAQQLAAISGGRNDRLQRQRRGTG